MRNAGFWGGVGVCILILILFNVLSSKPSGHGTDHAGHGHHGTSEAAATDHDDHHGKEHVADAAAVEEAPEDESDIDRLKKRFSNGSWEYEVLEFLESDEPTMTISLEKVPFDGEELPSEAKDELDHLAELQLTFPTLRVEVQAHSTAAKNAVGRKAKRTTCAARALWVKAKLRARGIDKEHITSSGLADDSPLPEIGPDDKGQRRIMAVLQKSASF